MPMSTQPAASGNDALLKLTTERALVWTPAVGAALAFKHKGTMICRATTGFGTPPLGCRLDIDSGFSGECVRTGKALQCDDTETDVRLDAETCQQMGIRSIVAVPILRGREVVGLLEVFSCWPSAFTDAHVAVLQRLAAAVLEDPAPIQVTTPKLLIQWEGRYRTFFGNLLALLRPVYLPLNGASQPGQFWPDVFVHSRVPWEGFFQSIAVHVMALAVLGSFLQISLVERRPLSPRRFNSSEVVYYLPRQSASMVQSASKTAVPVVNRGSRAGTRSVLTVARESRGYSDDSISPPEPNLKKDPRQLRFLGVRTLIPATPFPAGSNRLITPAALVAVAPAPELSGISGSRTLGHPPVSAIAPAPTVHETIRRVGDLSIEHLQVIGPAPQLAVVEQSSIVSAAAAALGKVLSRIVPPAPSASNLTTPGRQRAASMPLGTALSVVPPPPSATSVINSDSRHSASMPGYGAAVVPPPPSIPSTDAAGPSSAGALAAAVVPPPPSIGTLGSSSTGRAGSLVRAGFGEQSLRTQVVPPPPTVPFTGGIGTAAPARPGMGIVPPAPAADAVQRAGLRPGNLSASSIPVARPPAIHHDANRVSRPESRKTTLPHNARLPGELFPGEEQESPDAGEELNVAFLAPAVPLPNSTYFASEEIFLAQERVSRHESRLIKLIYEFLPYQPRLSDFGPNYPAVDRLRATRDPTCDEVLMQASGGADGVALSEAFPPQLTAQQNHRQKLLTCYRTTADDYREARARSHHQ
jgi:GAF domain